VTLVSAPGAATTFAAILSFTLRQEGVREEVGDTGYVDHPLDPGGATNWGITQDSYDAYRNGQRLALQPVRLLRRPEVDQLYHANYFRAVGGPQLLAAGRHRLALVAFDWGTNAGVVRGARYLQSALGVAVDGRVGPGTLAAAAALDAAGELAAVGRYLELRALHHRARAAQPSPFGGRTLTPAEAAAELGRRALVPPAPRADQVAFLRGWLARCRANARACGVPFAPAYTPAPA
jgi:hypothetical protein